MRPRLTPAVVVAFAVSQLSVVFLLLAPLANSPWASGFRNYFSIDQFSYASIATNLANGHFALVEPFTRTGSSYYPSLWYQVLGAFSWLTHVPVYLAWTLLGLGAVCLVVLAAGWVAWRLSRYWWAPIMPGLALAVGTFSTFTSNYWYTSLDNHAVLWGPYGTLFTLNGEVIALSSVALSALIIMCAQRANSAARSTLLLLVLAGAILGLTASIQTYSFFSGLTLAVVAFSVYGLLTAHRKRRSFLTIALLATLWLVGSRIEEVLGPLPMIGLLLACFLPGLIPVIRKHPRAAAAFVIPVVLFAAPQVLRTGLGILEQDPFLTYRQASTNALGVPIISGIIAAGVLLALVISLLLLPRVARPTWMTTAVIAVPLSGFLLAGNDHWGFNQEPYRLFLQFLILGAILLFSITPLAIRNMRVTTVIRDSRARMATVALAVTAVLFAFSLADIRGFWTFARDQGVFDAKSQKSTDISTLAGSIDEYIANGPCIDPQQLKLLSEARVPYFNRGLAWPANPDAIEGIIGNQRMGVVNLELMRSVGVDFIMTDDTCEVKWSFSQSDRVIVENKRGNYTLWRVLS
jgi:hypothetical protein